MTTSTLSDKKFGEEKEKHKNLHTSYSHQYVIKVRTDYTMNEYSKQPIVILCAYKDAK